MRDEGEARSLQLGRIREYRDRAEELRVIAESPHNERARNPILRISEDYERLARDIENMIQTIAESQAPPLKAHNSDNGR